MFTMLLLQLSKWGRRQPWFQQRKIFPRTHSSGSISICQHPPPAPKTHSVPYPNLPSAPPPTHHMKTDTSSSHPAHLSLIGLSVFFIPSLLSSGPVFRELISPCQPTSDRTTNSHTVGHRLLVCSQTCIGIAKAADTGVNVLSGIKNTAERSLCDMKYNNLLAKRKIKRMLVWPIKVWRLNKAW